MIGAQTIGNATIVAYDKNPILSTDPWLGLDHYAYFGSWYLPYEIPEKPELRLNTANASVDYCAQKIILKLQSMGLIDLNN